MSWEYLLIILLCIVGAIIVFSVIYRKIIIKQVDELERWKIQLENSPFSEQLSRVKELNMSGETELLFDKWREEWEDILTRTLPEVEETLIDIEEAADQYRFIPARKLLQESREHLVHIERLLEQIVKEIDDLTTSEEQNRQKEILLHEQFQELKSSLKHHVPALGASSPYWQESFDRTMDWFEQFTQAQENGDYFLGQGILNRIEERFEQVAEAIETIPTLLDRIENEIPVQIKEAELAIVEMKEKGYQLGHTQVEKRLESLKKRQSNVTLPTEHSKIKEVEAFVEEMIAEIDQVFFILEEEVALKSFVLSTIHQINEQMEQSQSQFNHIQDIYAQTKESYSWEKEWDEQLNKIRHTFAEVAELASKLDISIEELHQEYPALKPNIVQLDEKRQELTEQMQAFEKKINAVREDELQARELAERLKKKMVRIKMTLRKHNLPGVPDHLQQGMDMSDEALSELDQQLNERPLDIHKVQHYARDAKSQVDSVSQVAKSIIQQVGKAEHLIQYANRYRSSNREVGRILDEAEESFHSWQYREAVELTEKALDKADKRWRDKLVENQGSVS